MSLEGILLGIVRDRPASGYDIKQQFDRVFVHFWSATLPQIYRTLRKLQDEGLLGSREEPSDKGPDRRVYRITAKGKAALRRWLDAGPELGSERVHWLAQTLFLDALGDRTAQRAFLARLRDALAAERDLLREIARGWGAEDPRYPDFPDDDAQFFAQLTLDLGIHKLAVKAEWAERCIQRLDRRLMEAHDENAA
jgi:DNA-binding PadR family transcriptional regulator